MRRLRPSMRCVRTVAAGRASASAIASAFSPCSSRSITVRYGSSRVSTQSLTILSRSDAAARVAGPGDRSRGPEPSRNASPPATSS